MSQKHIFEDLALGLNARVRRKRSVAGAATFKFTRTLDGGAPEEVAAVELDALSKSWRDENSLLDFAPPLVPDGHASYDLDYKVEAFDKEYPGKSRYRVWRHKVTVTAVDEEDQPLPGAAFRVVQGDEVVDVFVTQATDDAENGTFTYHVRRPKPFAIEAQPPFEVLEWGEGDDLKAERRAKVRRNYPAAFIAPRPPEDEQPVRQFVNMATDDEGRDARGSVVVVEVGGRDDREREEGARLAKEGHKVYFKATFENPTERKSGTREVRAHEGSAVTVSEDSGADASPRVVKGHVELGEAGEAAFALELGLGGGERCTLEIGTTEQAGDDVIVFETWRKLYYELTLAEGLDWPQEKRKYALGALEEVFIHLEQHGDASVIPANDQQVCPPGAWVDGLELGHAAGAKLRCGYMDDNKGRLNTIHDHYYGGAKGALGVHVVLIHYLADVVQKQVVQRLSEEEYTDGAKIRWEGEDHKVHGFTIEPKDYHPQGFKDKWKLFATTFRALHHIYHPSTQAVWDIHWSCDETGDAMQEIPEANVRFEIGGSRKWGRALVRFPEAASDLLAAGKTLKVTYHVDFSTGSYCGVSDGAHMIFVDGTKGSKDLGNTIAHELGHAIGMCCDPDILKPADGVDKIPDIADPRQAHGRWYEEHGDEGNHCANAVNAVSYKNVGSAKAWLGDCVLFGHDQLRTTPTSFCARCKKILLAMEVSIGVKPNG